MAAKHLIAQVSKAFFGYGPNHATIWLQGRLAVFASALTGPRLQEALAQDPFGRACMRQINRLYVRDAQQAIGQAAAGAGVRLACVASDLDLPRRWALGVGIAERPLPGAAAEREATADWRTRLEPGLGAQVRDVQAGPLLVHASTRLPDALKTPGPEALPSQTLAHLEAWEAFRARLEAAMIPAVVAHTPLTTWAAVDDGAGQLRLIFVVAPSSR